jgi:hypothetical protein
MGEGLLAALQRRWRALGEGPDSLSYRKFDELVAAAGVAAEQAEFGAVSRERVS